MIVVSDSGPLIYLGAVGQLDILRVLFEHVVVPVAVWREVVDQGAGRSRADAVRSAAWIEVRVADELTAPASPDLLEKVAALGGE
jgi:predicted nucleic acid-binding protein